MAASPDWTDTVTAVSTALTAVAAIAAGIIAFVGFRRDARRELAHVEAYLTWKVHPEFGAFLDVGVKILNLSYETLSVNYCSFDKPKGTTLSAGEFSTHGRLEMTKGESNRVAIDKSLNPSGSVFNLRSSTSRTDQTWITLYAFPPTKWTGGTIKLLFGVSNASADPWSKVYVVKRRLVGPPRPGV